MCRLLWQCLVISLFFMFLHNDICSSSSSPSKPALCSPDQSFALLHFKNSFSIINIIDYGCIPNPKTERWKEGSDCCSWDGVTCDRLTGHVISLDVSCSGLVGTLYPNNTLFHLHHLRKLNLSHNYFSGSEISSMFGHFTKLTHLDLSSSNFSGSVPPEISDLSNLVSLNLSYNPIQLHQHSFDRLSQNLTNLRVLVLDSTNLSSIAPCSLVNLSSSIISLHLSSTGLQGKFPHDVLRFPLLEKLDLSGNGPFIGHLPKSNWSSPLRLLDFGGSNFYGDVMHDQIYLPDAIGDLVYLNVLNVASCGFKGSFSEALFNLTRLTSLDLGNNSFSGQLPSSIFNLTQLSYVDLSANQLEGHFPSQVGGLPHLSKLDLSNNLLSGRIPSWLLSLPSLEYLDLSDNKITGQISPEKLGLRHLNLSHNFLTRVVQIPLMKLVVLDLHSNLLQGPLAVPPHGANMTFFSVSHNNLTGEIPSMIYNMSSLEYLVLTNNSFSGMIPECLTKYEELKVLDLSMNNFHGSIPQIFPNGSSLKTIDLNGNQLEGPLPKSLANCNGLEVLDVGNNMVNGTFPFWLAALPELQVLILRSNRFLGCIGNSGTKFPFAKLRILDISRNKFTGILPMMLFKSFKTMMHGHEKNTSADYMGSNYYQDHVVLTSKGNELQVERILTILIIFDLSSNQFQGKIPKVVEKLKSLNVFNLSHNRLMGQIPSSLGNLIKLESLDLSSNKLTGEIPMQLTSLTFLSVLNVSYNQLVGPIPQGNQFNTFENNSYIGNSKLCGPPLSKKCINDEASQPVHSTFKGEEGTSSTFDQRVIMMGYVSGLVIGLSMGYMVFSTGKPHWFVKIFNRDSVER